MPKRDGWQEIVGKFRHAPEDALRAAASRRRTSHVEAAADEATVYIYDVIDSFFGVDAEDIAREIDALRVSTIHVRINSPGGFIRDGIAIYNALRRNSAEVVSHVDGLAASIASVIALAGDQVLMGEGAMMMIHNAWGLAIGDADEMRKTADVTEKHNDTLVGIYGKRTGKDENAIRQLMKDETWFDADEAVSQGFADDTEDAGAADKAQASLSERDAERALRDGGFSHAAAKAIVETGYRRDNAEPRDEDAPRNATPEPRDEDGEMAEILPALMARGNTLTLATR